MPPDCSTQDIGDSSQLSQDTQQCSLLQCQQGGKLSAHLVSLWDVLNVCCESSQWRDFGGTALNFFPLHFHRQLRFELPHLETIQTNGLKLCSRLLTASWDCGGEFLENTKHSFNRKLSWCWVCPPRHRVRAPTPTCPHLLQPQQTHRSAIIPDCSTAVFSTVGNPTQVFCYLHYFLLAHVNPQAHKEIKNEFCWVLRGCSWVKRTEMEMVGEDNNPVPAHF